MKVMLERRWHDNVNCNGCHSYLRVEEGDLRMTTEESVHIVCEVCDTKMMVENAPEYMIRKLKKMLSDKRVVDTETKNDHH